MDQKWRERRADYWDMATRYFRLIGNSGFMFSLLVAFIVGAYYYNKLLDWLPSSFPSALVFAVIGGFLLVRSPIRTFLREPDLVFLLPLEPKMTGYFRKSVMYSFVLQSFTMIVVMFLLSPLFYARISGSIGMFLFSIVVMLLVKYWNIAISWQEMYLPNAGSRSVSLAVRGIISFGFVWLLFLHVSIYFLLGLAAVMVVLSLFYYKPLMEKHTLKWHRLLEVEEGRLLSFYRMANMFTEVPRLKNRVKPRRLLASLTNRLSFAKKTVYTSLFFKTFIRADDYFGVYMRLWIIGMLLMLFLPEGYGTLIVLLLVVYISGTQLHTLWRYLSGGEWERLYPIPHHLRVRSFLHVVLFLLVLQAVVLGILLFISHLDVRMGAVGMVSGVLLSFLFTYGYVRKKIATDA